MGKILKITVTMVRSRVKSRSHHDAVHLHPQPMSLPYLTFFRNGLDKILKPEVTMAMSKVEPRSYHKAALLYSRTNVPI